MKTLPTELFKRYVENPLQCDEEVRKYCGLRDDRYYTVSVWPVEGVVRQNNQTRVVKAKKVSKSDQQ